MTDRPFKPTPAKARFLGLPKGGYVYFTYKHPWPMSYWYTLDKTALWAEIPPGRLGQTEAFDVRKLPEKYRDGLPVEFDISPTTGHRGEGYYIEQIERHAHRVAILRAVSDGFDLQAFADEQAAA